MNNIRSILNKTLVFTLFTGVISSGCKKLYNLPEEKDYISNNVNYSDKILKPINGRTSVVGTFNADNSSSPISFEIVNPRWGDGRPVTDMFAKVPTTVWTGAYTGLETSLGEIEAKRKIEEHPIFELRSSGQFILWSSSTDQNLPPRPDTLGRPSINPYVQEIRFFDVKIKNSGGERLIRDMQLIPFRERPYEPSDDLDVYSSRTPLDQAEFNKGNKVRNYIRPYMNNLIGATSNLPLARDNNNIAYKNDVVVYIRPFTGGNGHSLRIVALNKDSLPMNPAIFNETVWDKMIHGFNVQKTDTYVQYDVAYPIPVMTLQTKYTNNSGDRAKAELKYSRIGFGGVRVFSYVGVNFAIYKPGDWEIVFHFKRENPKFVNE